MKPSSSRPWLRRLLRSAALSVGSLLVLCGGFWVYWHFQPATPPVITRHVATAPTTGPSGNTTAGIGPGGAPWVDDYDGGKLTSMFHARTFNPRPDGQFDVDHPVWVFYLSDGQYLLLTGDSGLVHVDSDAANAPANNSTGSMMTPSGLQAPTSGTLQQVVVKLFPTELAAAPTLTFHTNNIAFDHDTLRLYTQAYTDEQGRPVTADRVPVTVRGDDYDFDGWGLTMHWNDRDRRLQLLQIDHGRSLLIKHPGSLSGSGAATTAPRVSALPDTPLPEQLADAAPASVAAAKVATSAPTPPTVYHALFEDQVRVFQNGRQMASSDDMGIDFEQGKQTGATKPAPLAAPAAPEPPPTAEPAAPPAAQRAAAAAPEPALAATTAPQTQPITVTWTGPLRLTPLQGPGALPLAPGQAVVRMVGAPVVLTPVGSTVTAAAVVYRSGDSAGRLENSPAVPRVHLAQDHGMRFDADSMSYDPASATATILGHSDLQLPVASDVAVKTPPPLATVTWSDRGLIHVITRNGQPSAVDHIDLHGDVDVKHPQFTLNSDALALDLVPAPAPAHPTTQPTEPRMELRQVTATGRAVCDLLQPGQPGQPDARSIHGDRIVLITAPGPGAQPSPREMVADGSVQASDPSQEEQLQAGHLDVLLAPKPTTAPANATTTQPTELSAVAVQSLFAADAVHAVLKGGSTADADELKLTTPGGRQQIILTGTADHPARVSDGKKNDLTGPVIRITPDDSTVVVDGPGTAHTDRRESATQPSQPVAVAWSHDLLVDGMKNTVDVHGDVVATAVDAQTDHDRITGNSAHADLMDAPRSTTQPIYSTTTAPSGMSGKQIRNFRLDGSVVGSTRLTDAATGKVLRQGELHGDVLTYDALAGRGTVPGPGTLVVDDHRPPDAPAPSPATPATDPPASGPAGGTRGSIAIAWEKSLTFDQPANEILFDGNVRTGFRQATPTADLMQMDCQQMLVTLTSPPPSSPKQPAANPPRMQVSSLLARGQVQFRTRDLSFTADTVRYDPTTALLTARGSPQVPGQSFNGASENTGTFDELVYDTRTELIVSMRGVHGEFQH